MPPKRLADCYFFYYSSCVRGDKCRFRHCAEALGTETVCPGWLDQTCREINCKYRHMEIQKDRTQEPCFWETQSGGCTKPHCAYYHHSQTRNLHAASGQAISLARKPLSENKENGAQKKSLREALDDSLADYFKKPIPGEEKEYNNPSPKVPPVVFNPWDEESDQEMTSPEKLVEKEIGALERKINVLEEESRVILQGNSTHMRAKSDILSRLGRKRTQDEQSRVVHVTALNADSYGQFEAQARQVVRCKTGGVKNQSGNGKNDMSNRSPLIGKLSSTAKFGDVDQLSRPADEEHIESGFEKVKIKTLAEIREEKAQRLGIGIDSDEPPSKVRRQSDKEEITSTSKVYLNTKGSSPEKKKPIVSAPSMKNQNTEIKSSKGEVRIKSFEEIMREKRSRRQESKTEITSTGQNPPKVLKQEATTTTSLTTAKRKGITFSRNVKSELDKKKLENPEIKKEKEMEFETVQSHDAPDSTQDMFVKKEEADTGLDEEVVKHESEEPAPACRDGILKPETTVSSPQPVAIKAESQIKTKRQISSESAKIQASRMSLGSNVDELELLLMEGGEETTTTQHIDDDDILKELDNMLQ